MFKCEIRSSAELRLSPSELTGSPEELQLFPVEGVVVDAVFILVVESSAFSLSGHFKLSIFDVMTCCCMLDDVSPPMLPVVPVEPNDDVGDDDDMQDEEDESEAVVVLDIDTTLAFAIKA